MKRTLVLAFVLAIAAITATIQLKPSRAEAHHGPQSYFMVGAQQCPWGYYRTITQTPVWNYAWWGWYVGLSTSTTCTHY